MQEHKSFLIRDLLGDVLSERVHGEFDRTNRPFFGL